MEIAKTRTSPAVGNDGVIYIASLDNFIYGIDSKNGEVKWEVRTGDANISSPLLDNKGNLYVGSNDGRLYAIATSSTGPAKSPWPMYAQNAQRTHRPLTKSELAAFSKPEAKAHSKIVPVFPKPNVKPGTTLWEWTSKDARPVGTPSLGYNGKIYVSGHSGALVKAIDRISGKLISKSILEGYVGAHVALTITSTGSIFLAGSKQNISLHSNKTTNGVNVLNWHNPERLGTGTASVALGSNGLAYYTTGGDRKIVAVEVGTGKKKWEYITKNTLLVSPSIGPDNTVYVGCMDANFYALNGETGSVKWKYIEKKIQQYGGGGVHQHDRRIHDAIIDDLGRVYITAEHLNGDRHGCGILIAVDGKTGTKIWETPFFNSTYAPVMDENGVLYLCSEDGNIYAINREDGKIKWKSKVGKSRTSPVVGNDEVIYIASLDNYIYAIDSKDGKVKWEVRNRRCQYFFTAVGQRGQPVRGFQ